MSISYYTSLLKNKIHLGWILSINITHACKRLTGTAIVKIIAVSVCIAAICTAVVGITAVISKQQC